MNSFSTAIAYSCTNENQPWIFLCKEFYTISGMRTYPDKNVKERISGMNTYLLVLWWIKYLLYRDKYLPRIFWMKALHPAATLTPTSTWSQRRTVDSTDSPFNEGMKTHFVQTKTCYDRWKTAQGMEGYEYSDVCVGRRQSQMGKLSTVSSKHRNEDCKPSVQNEGKTMKG